MRDYHVVLFGTSRTGKSSLTTRYVHGSFPSTYDPTIEDIYTKEVSVDGGRASLEILDTEGLEQYQSMRELYIRNADAFILLYDVTSRQSLEEVLPLEEQVRRIKGAAAPLLLVANKSDLLAHDRDAQDLARLGAKLASKMDAVHIVASAKQDVRVREVFETAVKLLRKQDPGYGHARENQSVSSASIDGLLFTPAEREAQLRRRPTLKASMLRIKKSVAGLKEAKSIRGIRRVVSRASFYHHNDSSSRERHARPAASTTELRSPIGEAPNTTTTVSNNNNNNRSSQAPNAAAIVNNSSSVNNEPHDDLAGPADGLNHSPSVKPVLQDSLTQLPEMLDVSGSGDAQPRNKGGVCAIM